MNLAWAASSVRAARRFRTALREPAVVQRQRLLRYLSANRDTAFGRAHEFSGMTSVEGFQERVPLRRYDDLEPWIERIARGERGVLTAATVERLVPSGGSTAAAKLIPFTAPLAREFSRAVAVWIADLFSHTPALLGGPAYWSITPPAMFNERLASAALPVGFADDTAYAGRVGRALARHVMAVPASVAQERDGTAFRYATVSHLLRARELRLISVWHPSFLEGLLDLLEEHRDRLAHDIAATDRRRADVLRASSPGDYRALWPRLSLISAWADGNARGPADALSRRLPGVPVQPKGLLATEGVVTIPLGSGHPLAIESHFFEFIDAGGKVRLAEELRAGEQYEVVVTTGGGLYRYRLGDQVSVDGFVENTPSLRFVGKADRVSDLFGEKLSDGFVAGVLQELFAGQETPRFAMLSPEQYSRGMAYTLFVGGTPEGVPSLERRLEDGLRRNPHYAWCVDLGQLQPARVVRVGPGATRAYVDACVARGQRLGDVKPAALRPDTGWGVVLPTEAAVGEAVPC